VSGIWVSPAVKTGYVCFISCVAKATETSRDEGIALGEGISVVIGRTRLLWEFISCDGDANQIGPGLQFRSPAYFVTRATPIESVRRTSAFFLRMTRSLRRDLVVVDSIAAVVDQEVAALGARDQRDADLLRDFQSHRGNT